MWPRSCHLRVLEELLTLPFLEGIVRVQPKPQDQKIPPQDPIAVHRSYQSDQFPALNASTAAGPGPSMPQTRVYHYANPNNGHRFTSLLPPDHPEMVCLQQGSHVEETKFGFLGEFFVSPPSYISLCLSRGWPVLIQVCWLGILAAIVWFPLGIGLCLLDRTVTCKRCGAVIKARPSIKLGGSHRRGRN